MFVCNWYTFLGQWNMCFGPQINGNKIDHTQIFRQICNHKILLSDVKMCKGKGKVKETTQSIYAKKP